MKFNKQIIFILIIFFKTETLFCENNLFNVNNIKLEKPAKTTNDFLASQAIQKGFSKLISRILLEDDIEKISDLNLSSIKQLVKYYQITNIPDENDSLEFVNFSVTFDKDKMHNLFYKKGISYSEIFNKELYILPIFIRESEIFIFNNNFFYEYWNEIYKDDLIEFNLPLENIEIIKTINENKTNLIDINIRNLFKEYENKNLALIFIEESKNNDVRTYIKSIILGKSISKTYIYKRQNIEINEYYKNIITETKKELINLVKSKNLIDIRTPSFLNVKLNLNKKSNLVELNSRIKDIDSIESIYVQEFNKNYMNLKIKYLGKLNKIINQLKKEKIDLQLINDQWVIKTL